MPYTVPLNEDQRSAAAARLLSRLPRDDARLDAITAELARVFDSRYAVVSLIEGVTQHILSVHGMSREYERERSHAIGAQVILDDAPLILADLHTDPRFAGKRDKVDGRKLRSFAGLPLTLSNGLRVGCVCVFDPAPATGPPGEDQIAILREAQREIVSVWESEGWVDDAIVTDRTVALFIATATDVLLDLLQMAHGRPGLDGPIDRIFGMLRHITDATRRQGDLSIGEWRLDARSVDVARLLDDVGRIAIPLFASRDTQLSVAMPDRALSVHGDPRMLQLAMLGPAMRICLCDRPGTMRIGAAVDDDHLMLDTDAPPRALVGDPAFSLARHIIGMHSGRVASKAVDGRIHIRLPLRRE